MQRATVGSLAKSVDDRVVGVIREVNWCCVRFETQDGQSATARWEGVFDIQHRVVTLIYGAGEPHRYQCQLHSGQDSHVPSALQSVARRDRSLEAMKRVRG